MRWQRRRRVWSTIAVLAAAGLAGGCTTPSAACTEIGSPPGLTVTVERDAVVDRLGLTLQVCQTDCLERSVELHPGSISVGQTCSSEDPEGVCSASASPDGTRIGFVDVTNLTAGSVRVSGELRTGSRTTRLDEVTVTASATYPNGRDCPAGGPQAAVRVTTTGLR